MGQAYHCMELPKERSPNEATRAGFFGVAETFSGAWQEAIPINSMTCSLIFIAPQKCFPNLLKSNQILIVITVSRLIWH